MAVIQIQLEDESLDDFGNDPAEAGREFKNAAVVKWYDLGRITQSRGAEILGISRHAFLDLLAKYDVSPFQYTAEEVMEEARRG